MYCCVTIADSHPPRPVQVTKGRPMSSTSKNTTDKKTTTTTKCTNKSSVEGITIVEDVCMEHSLKALYRYTDRIVHFPGPPVKL